MTDPVTELTFEPSSPRTITDGVLFSVTGPVAQGRIEVRDADGNLHQKSPVFGQKNRVSSSPNQALVVTVTGSPGGGNYKLSVYDRLSNTDYGQTGVIAHNASASAVETALEGVVGSGNVSVEGSNGGPYTVIFGEEVSVKFVSLTLTDNDLTGGTSPSVTISSSSVGELAETVLAGGPYYWGPIYLPDGASSVADVVATADDEDNNIYEGDSLLADAVVVYDYGDLS